MYAWKLHFAIAGKTTSFSFINANHFENFASILKELCAFAFTFS